MFDNTQISSDWKLATLSRFLFIKIAVMPLAVRPVSEDNYFEIILQTCVKCYNENTFKGWVATVDHCLTRLIFLFSHCNNKLQSISSLKNTSQKLCNSVGKSIFIKFFPVHICFGCLISECNLNNQDLPKGLWKSSTFSLWMCIVKWKRCKIFVYEDNSHWSFVICNITF